jgi:aspartate racemase
MALKRIGLIGGMSWESTLEYYRLINRGVQAALGGHHSAPCIINSLDFAAIERLQSEGRWDETGELLADAALALERAGAEGVILCTNTMHKVADRITRDLAIPFLHIGDATAARIEASGLTTVGLLGTRYTMEQAFYRDRLTAAGLAVITPDAGDRQTVNAVIYDELCLGRIEPASKARYLEIIARLAAGGAQGVILGCTEIGLLVSQADTALPLFDTTAIHAAAAAAFCLGRTTPAQPALQPA